MLMESGDFEILFYDGSKYQNTSKKVSLHLTCVYLTIIIYLGSIYGFE